MPETATLAVYQQHVCQSARVALSDATSWFTGLVGEIVLDGAKNLVAMRNPAKIYVGSSK
jgi:hypothetical protein